MKHLGQNETIIIIRELCSVFDSVARQLWIKIDDTNFGLTCILATDIIILSHSIKNYSLFQTTCIIVYSLGVSVCRGGRVSGRRGKNWEEQV